MPTRRERKQRRLKHKKLGLPKEAKQAIIAHILTEEPIVLDTYSKLVVKQLTKTGFRGEYLPGNTSVEYECMPFFARGPEKVSRMQVKLGRSLFRTRRALIGR